MGYTFGELTQTVYRAFREDMLSAVTRLNPVTVTTVSASACPATTATFTTTTPHLLSVNDKVYVTGMTPAAYNGTWYVTTIPIPTQFTVVITTSAPGAGSVFGTVTPVDQLVRSLLREGVSWLCRESRAFQRTVALNMSAAAQVNDAMAWARSLTPDMFDFLSVKVTSTKNVLEPSSVRALNDDTSDFTETDPSESPSYWYTDRDGRYWGIYPDYATVKGAWTALTAYVLRDMVSSGGAYYLCSAAHTSSTAGAGGNEPGVGATWASYWTLCTETLTVTGNIEPVTTATGTQIGEMVADSDVPPFQGLTNKAPALYAIWKLGTAYLFDFPDAVNIAKLAWDELQGLLAQLNAYRNTRLHERFVP